MFGLHARLKRCGFEVIGFSYASMRNRLDKNAAQLSRFIDTIEADVVHLVAHSLGGLVTLRALQMRRHPRVRRIVLLGSPVAGSLSGRRLARFGAGRLLLGNSRHIWDGKFENVSPEGVAVGIIAGSVPIGLGRLLGKIPGPHDGVVAVAETQVINSTDTIVLPVTHTALLLSGRVGRQVCSFLRDARFVHAGSTR